MATTAAAYKKLRRDIRILKNRIKVLERVLKPASPEEKARRKALDEFNRERHFKHLRECRMSLRWELEDERETNEFLKSRGFEPLPSRIPDDIRQLVRIDENS